MTGPRFRRQSFSYPESVPFGKRDVARELLGKMFLLGGENALDGQANDITQRAFDALNQASLVLLGGIAAGLVQGIDA